MPKTITDRRASKEVSKVTYREDGKDPPPDDIMRSSGIRLFKGSEEGKAIEHQPPSQAFVRYCSF